MSDREKKLLIFLLGIGFLVINAAAYKMVYLPKKQAAVAKAKRLDGELKQAREDLESQEDIRDEMDWLAKYEPEAQAAPKAESDLEGLANREAQRRGLTVKRRKILPAIIDGNLAYNRARVELEVSGREQVLYQWLDRLHSPADFRAVTMMRMNPKRDDDTQVDCLVVIEQWFVPERDTPPTT